jgi:ribonuclease HI
MIVFDGGAIGNPGKGYGSFEIRSEGRPPFRRRLEFSPNGELVTNNEAEYRTLIGALSGLAEELGPEAAESSVHILGDSQLVINQLTGAWKVRQASLRPLHAEASRQLCRFRSHTLRWQPRSESVRLLGH